MYEPGSLRSCPEKLPTGIMQDCLGKAVVITSLNFAELRLRKSFRVRGGKR
jgi:hypothetical protein